MTILHARTSTAADRIRDILHCHSRLLSDDELDTLTADLMRVVESTAQDVAQHIWDKAIPAWIKDRSLPIQARLNVSVLVRPNRVP